MRETIEGTRHFQTLYAVALKRHQTSKPACVHCSYIVTQAIVATLYEGPSILSLSHPNIVGQ